MIAFKPAKTCLASGALSAVLMAAPAVASTRFSDTTFSSSDYILTSFGGPSVTTSLAQSTSGNPGTALEGTYAAFNGNGAGVLFTALNQNFVYDPTVRGAITSISASLDRFFSPTVDAIPIAVGSYSLRILAEQNGKIYQAVFTFGPFNQLGGDWHTLATSNIQASDFKLFDPANFSAPGSLTGLDYAGSAITFGFAMRAAGAVDSNGAPVNLPSAGTLRADNFNVSIASVPEPSAWLMMVLGFGFVGAAMRRPKRAFPVRLAI
ncbi:PEPxxWA-CTERM sorting domain-containing protein [Sphingomonas azotifigens]|uniref:PEPxxWA-CTERM sorting domain-containing protein n=1 Tax=Sphingomonas azotifigens TaxID=330920 RepID=UPI00142FA142|nr:PEPxxWA-CTERM sorting domain-containing protein [Sphingomonas azotifigens]